MANSLCHGQTPCAHLSGEELSLLHEFSPGAEYKSFAVPQLQL